MFANKSYDPFRRLTQAPFVASKKIQGNRNAISGKISVSAALAVQLFRIAASTVLVYPKFEDSLVWMMNGLQSRPTSKSLKKEMPHRPQGIEVQECHNRIAKYPCPITRLERANRTIGIIRVAGPYPRGAHVQTSPESPAPHGAMCKRNSHSKSGCHCRVDQ